MLGRKNCLEIWTPREKKISINGESYSVKYLCREDFINIFLAFFQEYLSSLKDLGVQEILNGNKISLGAAHKILITASDTLEEILKASIPEFEAWSSLRPADQLKLFDMIWEYNDIPGMLRCFFIEKARVQNLVIEIGQEMKKSTPGQS